MDIAPIDDPRHGNGYFDSHYEPPGLVAPAPKRRLAILTAEDLRRKVFQPIKYVVPDFLVEGCTLFAGRPKLGKSWLMLDCAIAVAAGRYTLNQKCIEGDVLYLALEDNERRLKGRINKILGTLADQWPKRLHLATECPRSNEGGLEAIRDWAGSVETPRLVIVDVLAMFKPTRGDKESVYEADYAAIKGLQQLAADLGLAIVVVSHTRKGAADSDPFEKVSGTLGLSGAADTTIILDRDQNGFTLYGRGRDIQEFEHAVSYDRETCRFTMLGKADEVRRTDERSTILSVLKDADEPMTPTDLTAATGMSSGNIRQLLFKMGKADEVVKIGRGHYAHPERRDLGNNDNKITTPAEKPPLPSGTADLSPWTDKLDDNKPDNKITAPAEKLSVPATMLMDWLRTRPERPINHSTITGFGPNLIRRSNVRVAVLDELGKRGLIRLETIRGKGRPALVIHLHEGASQ